MRAACPRLGGPAGFNLHASWILTLLAWRRPPLLVGFYVPLNGLLVAQGCGDERESKTCRSGLWGPALVRLSSHVEVHA